MNRAAILVAVIGLVACDLLGSGDSRTEALEAARRRWARVAPADYSMTVEQLCFCGQEAIGPVLLQVSGGEVVTRTYVESGDPVPELWARSFPDVEGLFEVVEDAIERDAHRIEVTYDPDWGYPQELSVDYLANLADDETKLTVLGFTPAPAFSPSP